MTVSTVSIRSSMRPIRVGWCLPDASDPEGLVNDARRAVMSNTLLWGGMYNPLVIVGNDDRTRQDATNIVRTTLVDVLDRGSATPLVAAFAKACEHLRSPYGFQAVSSVAVPNSLSVQAIDIRHAIASHAKQLEADRAFLRPKPTPAWRSDDPLADILLVMFGSYEHEIAGSYYQTDSGRLWPKLFHTIPHGDPLPEDVYTECMSPIQLTTLGLEEELWDIGEEAGIYVGNATDPVDWVAFWNLRASGMQLVFYDALHADRLAKATQAWVRRIESTWPNQQEWNRRLTIWHRPENPQDIPNTTGLTLPTAQIRSGVGGSLWNGLNLQPALYRRPWTTVLGTIVGGDNDGDASISVQLPRDTFFQCDQEIRKAISNMVWQR
jgi:hypothetical protein